MCAAIIGSCADIYAPRAGKRAAVIKPAFLQAGFLLKVTTTGVA